jgi:hypothetical protein
VSGSWRWSWSGPDGEEAGHLGLVVPAAPAPVQVVVRVRRPGRDLVVLDEPEAPRPRAGSLEVRASGLWVDAVEEEPGRRWSVGLEAFALEVVDPEDRVGVRIPLGFDLEWEATGGGTGEGGRRPAQVHGEVLVGPEVLDVEADGWWATPGPGGAAH